MPVERIKKISAHTQLAIWKIEEDYSFFIEKLNLSPSELDSLSAFKSEERQIHWLASRVLIRTLLKTDQFIELEFDQAGKPILINFPYEVSITHSGSYAGVILSNAYQVGIDIESLKPQLSKIAHKFIPASQLSTIDINKDLNILALQWSAKESLYKLFAKGKLDFREHLFVPSDTLKQNGKLEVSIQKDNFNANFQLNYEFFDDYVLTYVEDLENLI